MDDEIDIEEHDVLDNPMIKSIFPDITALKKEITYYFEDEPVINGDADTRLFPFVGTDGDADTRPFPFIGTDGDADTRPFPLVGSDGDADTRHFPFVGTDGDADTRPFPFVGTENLPLESVSNSEPCELIIDVDNYIPQNEENQPKHCNKIIIGSKPIAIKPSLSSNFSGKLLIGSKPDLDLESEHGKSEMGLNPSSLTQDQIGRILIFGSRPDVVTQADRKQHITSKPNVVTQKKDGLILLGSNPKDSHDNDNTGTKILNDRSTAKHIKIILKDIKSYLNENSRYCKKCCRLFLRKNTLETHKNEMHPKNKKRKIYPPKEVVCKDTHKCICGSYFSCKTNLYRHYKNIHADIIKASMSSRSHSRKDCAICNIRFKTLVGLTIHNISKHQKNLNKIKRSIQQKGRNLGTYAKENDNAVSTTLSPNKRRKFAHKKESNMAITSEQIQDHSTASAKLKRPSANKTNELISLSRNTASDRKERIIAKAKHKSKTVIPKNNSDSTTDTNLNKSVKKNHASKYVTRANSTYTASNLCLHCNKKFPDQKSLTEHMYQIIEPKRCLSGSTEKADTVMKTQDDKILFACRHCSYYLLGISNYFTHIIKNHQIEKFLQINKEKFDPKCKFCSFKCSSITTHNDHIHRNHFNLMYVKIEDEIEHDNNKQLRKNSEHFYEDVFSEYKEFALESVLFECSKCSTCFLSSDIAMDHEQHKELLINWKCTICSLILKEQNKVMHLRQHSSSESVKVITLNETANVIYICTKCAIHFTENMYQKHYPICGLKIADSFYCSKCDMLVDKAEKNDHESQHEKFGNTLDFTIVNSNVIIIGNDASLNIGIVTTFEPGHIKRTVEHNCLTYCPTCKVFLKDLGLKNKNHIKGTCSQVLKYICNECGLVFTSSVLTLHKEHHEKEKSLRLQDFKFFDLQGKQVNPPIPEYPNCTRCGIHFLRKKSSHTCDETDFLTCDICDIKLTEKAYTLHMAFHFYVIQTSRQESENVPHTPKEYMTTNTIKSNKQENERSESTSNRLKDQIKDSKPTEPCTEKLTDDESLVVLYTCKPCSISFESYDEVIKHCQTHYYTNECKKRTSVKKCNQCLLIFDSRYYICHEQRVHFGVSKIQVLKFDPRYYTSKNTVWIRHIFESLTKEVVAKLLEKSIYQHEHRIQLECIQRGSSNVFVYKCDKCKYFIDQGGVFKHAKNPCGNANKHPCSYCGLNYCSWLSRTKHEDLHQQDKSLTKKSLNIILFNQKKDTLYNGRVFSSKNQNIFYQCRNCSGVTEKSIPTNHKCDIDTLVKCKICGLLLSNIDFKAHMAKHNHTQNFCAENFKVILFGNSNVKDLNNKKKLSSSFVGTVYDYSVFKCKKCEMCLRNTENAENHVCSKTYDLDRLLCHDCNLYFPSSYYKLHERRHQTDPDFIKDNMNVIEFIDGKIELKSDVDHIKLSKENNTITVDDDDGDNVGRLGSFMDEVDENPAIDDKTLYKCKCGLHFVNKLKVAEHVKTCQRKQYKQNCSKCNLLFNASELFSHLIVHHKDKSKVCNLKVVELTENVIS